MRCNFDTYSLEELKYYAAFFTDTDYASCLDLFHYTNLKNKELISQEDAVSLRLTRADAFDDADEGKHIRTLFSEIIREASDKHLFDSKFISSLKNAVNNADGILEKARKYYVVCFSKLSYDPYLIKNYAWRNNEDRCIIELDALSVEEVLYDESLSKKYVYSSVDLYDVTYNNNDILKKYIMLLLNKCYELRGQDTPDYKIIQSIILNQLAIYGLAYKSPEFEHDNETRLVVDISKINTSSGIIVRAKDKQHIYLKLPISSLNYINEVLYPDKL